MEAISSGASYWRNRKRRSVTNDRSRTQCDPSGILAYGDLLLPRLRAVAGANQSDDRYPYYEATARWKPFRVAHRTGETGNGDLSPMIGRELNVIRAASLLMATCCYHVYGQSPAQTNLTIDIHITKQQRDGSHFEWRIVLEQQDTEICHQ